MSGKKSLLWFRQDLRLDDNPALIAACEEGQVVPIYILDDSNAGVHAMGSASRVWLHHALHKLDEALNGCLNFFKGDPLQIIPKLISEQTIDGVYWNRCYEPWRVRRDTQLKKKLHQQGCLVNSFNGSLLWEPWEVFKKDGSPYRVFTPFYQRGCLALPPPRQPMSQPKDIETCEVFGSVNLTDLKLLPVIPWDKPLVNHWDISDEGGKLLLDKFLKTKLDNYKEGRNFPAKKTVSRLSPYLHFGQLSPNQVWFSAREKGVNDNTKVFCSELGWREFSYYLLYHFPDLPQKNWNSKFDAFDWQPNDKRLHAWQKGLTGYPLVDAGMRELWQTGFMHNRVRMVVASFLVKNCLIDWREGEKWFWNCLVDADLASNSASWQWVAGCGADATPYFRIFNPVTQGEKFDPTGEYTKYFVPELANLPQKYLFNPCQAPQEFLDKANVKLGQNYPRPLVDLRASRELALSAYNAIKDKP